jgi:hypothetical protein
MGNITIIYHAIQHKGPEYVGRSNLNKNLVPFQAQINLYEHACADKL